MLFNQGCDDLKGLTRVTTSLKPQSDEVHPNETDLLFNRLLGRNALLPDRHRMLIHPLLESPNPVGGMAHHAISFGNLRNGDVGAFHPRTQWMIGRRKLNQGLGLGN